MKNVLKAKPLNAEYIRKINDYFSDKSHLFDTFDEIFLHIGFVLDSVKHEPSELVELAIEDIVFKNSEEMQRHVSKYFHFHNSIVKFLGTLESAKDSDEIVKKSKKVSKALYKLCDRDIGAFQDKLAEEAGRVVEIIFAMYGVSEESEDLVDEMSNKIDDDLAVKTLANVVFMIPSLQAREFDKKEAIGAASAILLLCMVFAYLKKINKIHNANLKT